MKNPKKLEFTELVGQVVWDKYKEIASKNKYK